MFIKREIKKKDKRKKRNFKGVKSKQTGVDFKEFTF
jgi:hypothetical protein